MSNKKQDHIVDVNKKVTSVDWLAEKYDYITWMRNRDEISPAAADKWRKDFLEQAKEMEKQQIMDAYNSDRPLLSCFEDGSAANEYYKETYETSN